MKRKSLLFVLLLALMVPWTATAQETVTIGDGTTTQYYVPIGTYYNYSISEQLYTADEIGTAGTIQSISFYYAGTIAKDFPITVYMKHVDASNLSTGISLADATQVFNGTYSVSASSGWYAITLDTPFEYDGESNLLIGINKDYLYWYSNGNWQGTAISDMARYSNQDSGAYTTSTIPGTIQANRPNLQLSIIPQAASTCAKPETLVASDVTSASATLTWSGGSGTYNVDIKGGSYTDWTPVLAGTTLLTTTLTDLDATTAYQARVQSVCDGEEPSGYKTVSFTTPCAEVSSFPWTENFNNLTAGIPNCWDNSEGTTTTASYKWNYYATGHESVGLRFNSYNNSTGLTNFLKTPVLNFPDESEMQLAFWYKNPTGGDFSVFISTDGGNTYTTSLATGLTGQTNWTKKEIDLTEYVGTQNVVIVFKGTSNYGNGDAYIYLDDVTVRVKPSCIAPTNLAATDITTNSAKLSWTANSNETAWTIFYKKAGQENYTEVAADSNPYILNGLDDSSNYQFYVVANCSATDASEPSDVFSFATACDVIPAVGYTENFDSFTAPSVYTPTSYSLTNCWGYINTCTYDSYKYYPTITSYSSSSNAHSASNYLRFYSYYSSYYSYDPQPQYAILPEMSGLAGTQVTLWARGGTSTSTFKIGTMTDPADASTFVAITEQALTTSYQLFEYIIPADAQGNYLAIMIDGATSTRSSNSVYIDDIAITEAPTCLKPTGLTVVANSVTGHEATLSWTDGAEGQTQWQICLNGDEDNLIMADSNPFTLTGLAGQTTYTAKVRAYCSEDDQSDWCNNTVNFTTAVTCTAPTALGYSQLTNHSARLSWSSEATEWILAYKLYSAHDSTYVELPVTENPYTIEGLAPETRYAARVRANCGAEDGLSSWTSTISFTTLDAYPAPASAAVDSVFANDAYLSWFEGGTAETWQVAYKLATQDDTLYVTIDAFENPYHLEGLTPDTNYVYRVRSVYPLAGEEGTDVFSPWSAAVPFTTLQTCPAPTEVALVGNDSITATTATLTWNSIYSDNWNVKYREPDYVNGIIENFGTANPTGWEMYTGLLNNGTATLSSSDYAWSFGSSSGVFDNHAKVNIYGTNQRWLVTPAFTVPAGIDLGFDLALTAYSGTSVPAPQATGTDDKFIVLISTDNMSTWTTLREWNNSGSEYVYNNIANTATGEHVSIDLSTYAGQNVRIAFYGESTISNADNYMHIDNVVAGIPVPATEWTTVAADAVPFELTGLNPDTDYEVVVASNCGEETSEESASFFFTTLPSCLAPEGLALANVADSLMPHTATLSWTENGTATEWVLAYKVATAHDSTYVEVRVAENPYTLTGLLAETAYTAKVQAYCSQDDQSAWSDEMSFTTSIACNVPTELAVSDITTNGATLTWNGDSDSYIVMIGEPDPENEDVVYFETTVVDTDFEDQVIPAALTNSTTYPWTVTAGGANGSGYCAIPGNNGEDNSSSDLTIVVTGPGTVSFNAKVSSESSYDYGRFLIDGTQKVNISGSYNWTAYSFELAEGEHTLIWRYYKDGSTASGNDLFYVDDIMITTLRSMPAPSSWTEITTEEATYTFEDLTPNTNYMVRVKGVCGDDESHLSAAISFATEATCVVPTDFAATEVTAHTATMVWNGENDNYVVNYRVAAGTQDWINADFENGLPDGWTNEGASSWSVGTGDYAETTGAHSGTYNAKINHGTTGAVTYLVSPAIDLSEQSDLSLKLWYINRSWAGDTDGFGIYYRIDGGAWNEIFATTDAHSIWTEFNQALPAGAYAANCQFGFKFTDEYGYGVGLDDINISIPTPAGEWMTATAADTTVVLNSLVAQTTYEAMVQAVCTEEDSSEFTDIITFTTTEACPAVTALDTISVDAHSAVLTWIETGGASAWQICLNGDENNLIDVVVDIVNDTVTYMLEGLEQDADYTVKVRANCGDEDGTSLWSNTISFHTVMTCAKPTNLVADNINTDNAMLTWEGTSDAYVVQYRPWLQVGDDQVATAELTTYTYDLSEYSGTGSIAIRHYDITDMFRLNVDDIVVTNADGDTVFSENFENGTIPANITNMDLDGDGNMWQLMQNDASAPTANGNYYIASASYDNNMGALNPDNWMIISGIELGGQLSFVARGQDATWPSENFGVFVSADDEFVEETVEGDNMLELWDLTPNTSYAWQVKADCGEDQSQWVASFFTTADDAYVFVTNGDWNDANNWDPAELPTSANKVRIEANAIIPAGVVAEANKVTIEGGSITIKDGGQLKQSSATLKVTMEKEITGYGEGNGNFELVATPFIGRTQFGTSTWNYVDSLIYGTYDLYTFDPANGTDQEWVNYKANAAHINYQSTNGSVGLIDKEGYLYANQNNVTLKFVGNINSSNNAVQTKAVAHDSINKGWALVGNSFACNAYLSFVDGEGETMEANYYVMNAAGDDIELAETTDGIAPLTAVFVNFGANGYVQLTSEMPNPAKVNRSGKFSISLSQEGNTVDKAVVRFGKGRSLEKMSLKNNSKLFITMNDKDYAVVYSQKSGNMPVSFKAEAAGSYTINCAADGVNFKQLTLIDNVNETKVDLLANPSYTFETEAGEFAGRFTIVYRVK